MRLLWTYLKTYKALLVLALVLATINQVFSLLDPQIFRLILDNYASKIGQISRQEFLQGVLLLSLASIAVVFVSRVAKNFQDYYVNVIVQRLGTRMYADSVSHSFSLPYAVFEDQRSGEFLDKLRKARSDAQALVQQIINTMFLSLVTMLFVLGYAFYVNWMISLSFIVSIPLLAFVFYITSKKIKQAQSAIVKETNALAGSTTETLRNVELVKSLGLEQQEISRLNVVNEQILALELKKVRLVRIISFLQGTTINAIRSALQLLMLWLVFTRAITLGEFFSLIFYSFFLFGPLGELGNVLNTYQEARASLERLDEILKMPKAPKPAHPVAIPKIQEIKFTNVGFQYGSSQHPAITNINFTIKPGTTIALAGPSGSGKTTIIKLLVGLYEPTSGSIEFNGSPSQQIDFDGVRKRVGFVSQDTQLFAGTIRENLQFAKPDASDQECEDALRASASLGLVERGTLGLGTKIGEGGLKLSGGEKQRLAIARALLRQPDVIIFDEATSSLDSLTEQDITDTIKNIKDLRPDLISILVAHRLSTIVHADVIYILEKGQIVESGNHHSLLANPTGLYSALWRQQTAES